MALMMKEKQAVTYEMAAEYQRAAKKRKGEILDSLVRLTRQCGRLTHMRTERYSEPMVRPVDVNNETSEEERSHTLDETLRQPLQSKAKVQLLIERLAKAVADGLLRPGAKLPSEREMAEDLRVSRSIVREAFSALAATGLIVRREGRGNFVAPVVEPALLREKALALLESALDPYDVSLAREALEPALAEMAVRHASNEDFGKLAVALNALSQACNSRHWEAYFLADQRFHAALVASTHNRAAIQVMEPLLDGMQTPIWTTLKQSYFLEDPSNAATSARDHQEIAEAVLARDAAGLSAALKRHFGHVRAVLEYDPLKAEDSLP